MLVSARIEVVMVAQEHPEKRGHMTSTFAIPSTNRRGFRKWNSFYIILITNPIYHNNLVSAGVFCTLADFSDMASEAASGAQQ